MEKVLIAGIAGGHGRLLAQRLLRDYQVVGVDRVPWPAKLPNVAFYRVDVRTRRFEDVLRKEHPTTVVHLGFVRHFREKDPERYDINVRGTRKLLDHCHTYNVEKVVLLSTSYVYGALPRNACFMDEEYPLSASENYPEIRDLVEVDTLASSYMWRYPEIRTAILRPVPTLGHYIKNAIGNYLRMRRVIVMMGFNPMMQFMHEEDLTEALVLAIAKGARGAFNVTGAGELPLRVAICETGGTPAALPEIIARPLITRLFRMGVFPFPPGSIDYIKYPCTISGERFIHEMGFRPRFGLKETLRSMQY